MCELFRGEDFKDLDMNKSFLLVLITTFLGVAINNFEYIQGHLAD